MTTPSISRLFSEAVESLEGVRAPFREAMRTALGGAAPMRLIFTPQYEALGHRTPASLLAVTQYGWTLAESFDGAMPAICGARYEDTLWIELRNILLFGQLTLHYVVDSRLNRACVEFNTVMNTLYLDAAYDMLRTMSPENAEHARNGRLKAVAETLPYKYRSALHDYLPPEAKAMEIVYWDSKTRHDWLWRSVEVISAGMLVVTAAYLIAILDDRSAPDRTLGDRTHFGKRVQFLSRSHLFAADSVATQDGAMLHLRLKPALAEASIEVHTTLDAQRVDQLASRLL